MPDKLVKEIITTTTERFNDNGSIKEKITESREKVYATNFSEEEIKKAKVVTSSKEKKEEPVQKNEQKDDMQKAIEEAAKALDTKKPEPKVEQSVAAPQIPQYNVASRNNSPIDIAPFPWEVDNK